MTARAVLVVPVMPAYAGNGLAMRAGLLLDGLSRAFAVDLVVVPAFGSPAPPGSFVSQLANRVHTLEAASADPVADMARRLSTPTGRARAEVLHPLPQLSLAATPAAAEQVAALALGAALVVVMRTYLAPALDALLDAGARPPIVLDVDDIESDTQRALGLSDAADRLERLEDYYLPRVDEVICCSENDAAVLASHHRVNGLAVVPNAVRVPATVAPASASYDLLLVGTLAYEPNAEAARWLVADVLPLLTGDVRIAIVGRRPPAEVLALGDDARVTVAADVVDVSPWYASSRVAVVPIMRGGGTHIKLIEALAHGLPVVSTPVGARGLPWPGAPGPVVIAGTADRFATACDALLSEPARARDLGERGRELVSRYASVERVTPAITSLARRVANGRPLLSAALIVRDEEAVLGECLRSLEGVADQIVVVDTGSVDRTVEIAREHGAEVLQHLWADDFSAARNAGLDHVRGEWVLYVDADERVRPVDRQLLEVRLGDESAIALRVLLRPVVDSTPYYEYRLWRNDPRIRFVGVMHERVVDAIHAAAAEDGKAVEDWPALQLDHVGYEGEQRHKHIRNLPLLEEQLRREPGNVFNWRHLSRVLSAIGREDDAERALERAVSIARMQAPPTVDGSLAWADLIRLRHQRGDDVTELLAEARSRWPQQWLIRFIEGLVALDAARLDEAEACFRALIAVDLAVLPDTGMAYDERIFGSYAQSSLGLTLFRAGRFEEAAAAYAAAERSDPSEPEYRVKRMLSEARAARNVS